jgi:hypothetical protein
MRSSSEIACVESSALLWLACRRCSKAAISRLHMYVPPHRGIGQTHKIANGEGRAATGE